MPDIRSHGLTRRLVRCDVCPGVYEQGTTHVCPEPPIHLPTELAGMDLERLTLRQWAAKDCVLCAEWLGNKPTSATRRVADVHGCVLRACAPHCPPRGRAPGRRPTAP
ncbi:hypothetical protein [Streptomyces specialis]|uniref:hypothetical protein n=1 Tax=Streptomyces specialis TaxID=498367 RepID=UPI000A5AFCCB|nr:hypothetical protein [Streptomyces specialis]